MNDQSTNLEAHEPSATDSASEPEPTSPPESAERPARNRIASRPRGVGAMGPRLGDPDEPAPQRQVVEEAKSAALVSGHRFDLMRYLRLRRKR